MAKKSKPTKAEQRSAAAKRGWATRKAEARKRSDAARRGWEARRAAAQAKPEKTREGARGKREGTREGARSGGGRTAPVAAPPRQHEPKYAPEFDDLDDFFGGADYEEEDEY